MAESTPTESTIPLHFPRARLFALTQVAACGILVVLAIPWLLPLGSGMEQPFWVFLGRFHPLVVHLPIGMFLLAAGFEIFAIIPSLRHLRGAIGAILFCAALGATLAVAHGCLLAAGGGDTSPALQRHLQAGVALAICLFLLLPLRLLATASMRKSWRLVYHLFFWQALGLLAVASHLGGNLTHGPDYLVKYMPQEMQRTLSGLPSPLRKFIGLPEPVPLAQPTLYTALIAPAFENHCVSCHNEGKSKGGLRLDNLDALMKGGESGTAIVIGDLDKSEVHRRVTLPADDDEFMPPDGKPALSAEQVAVLEWWIRSGKPGDTPLTALGDVPPAVEKTLAAYKARMMDTAGAEKREADARALEKTLAGINNGFSGQVMPLSQQVTDGIMLVTAGAGVSFDDAALARIDPVAAHLREVDLSRTGVTDNGLVVLARAEHLRELRLANTGITAAAIDHLAQLKELEVLNLFATQVDDSAVNSLATMASLRKLYLAGTKLSPAAIAKLTAALPDCTIIGAEIPSPAPTASSH